MSGFDDKMWEFSCPRCDRTFAIIAASADSPEGFLLRCPWHLDATLCNFIGRIL